MRIVARLGAGVSSLLALLALGAGTTLAGGYAEVVMPDASDAPPVAGEERDIEFTLLQHGVTPVDFGQVSMTAVNAETGETVTVAATAAGGGEWTARLTFPSAGDWRIQVAHDSLETSMPTSVAVADGGAASWLPAGLAVGIFGILAVALIGWMAVVRGGDAVPSSAAPRTATSEG